VVVPCVKTGYVAVTVAAPALNPDAAKPNSQAVKATEPAPNKCSTDGHIFPLMLQIMSGPETTEIGDDSVKAACCLPMRKQRLAFSVHAAHFVPSISWTPLQRGVTK
jgi:hypothetical protein